MTDMSDNRVRIPKAPGFLSSALRVFDLSVGEMLWSRRTIFMALVVGAPVLISLCPARCSTRSARRSSASTASTMAGPAIFGLMIWVFYLRFTVPVLGVFYGTSLIADEVEDKTITYLFTRPIPKGAVLVGKYLAYLACTFFVVLPSVVLVYLRDRADAGQPGRLVPRPVKDLVLLAIGLAVYGVGVRLHRRPVQAAAPGRADLHLRLGAGGAGVSGLPQEVHGRLLPPGDGAARHAERHGHEPDPGHFPGEPVAAGEPVLAGRDFVGVFVGWRL